MNHKLQIYAKRYPAFYEMFLRIFKTCQYTDKYVLVVIFAYKLSQVLQQ